MKLQEYLDSLTDGKMPKGLSAPLRGLWYDGRGDWQRAHQEVQEESDNDSSWVHAYLHRKEGDIANASYWYRQAGKAVFSGDLQEEWGLLVESLLKKSI